MGLWLVATPQRSFAQKASALWFVACYLVAANCFSPHKIPEFLQGGKKKKNLPPYLAQQAGIRYSFSPENTLKRWAGEMMKESSAVKERARWEPSGIQAFGPSTEVQKEILGTPA